VPQDEKFGSGSLAAAATAIFLAVSLQPTPWLLAVRAGETAAWATPLIAGAVALLLYLPVAIRLGALPGGGNLISLARAAAGEPAAIGMGLLVCVSLDFDSGLIIRRVAESTVTHLYPHTPQTFVMVALSLCALYGASGGLADLVRLGRILLPVFLLTLCVILIGPLPWCNVRNLLPFWGPGPGPLLVGSIRLVGLFTAPILFLLLAGGQLRDRDRLWRAGIVAGGGAILLLMAIFATLLLVYPLPLGYSVTFPLQELTRLVTGGRFFERIESLTILIEFFMIACYLSAILHAAAAAYAGAFRICTHRTVLLPLFTLALLVSLIPTDQGQAIKMRMLSIPFAAVITYLLPLLLTLRVAWQGRAQGRGC
jgi:spore germination protein KB